MNIMLTVPFVAILLCPDTPTVRNFAAIVETCGAMSARIRVNTPLLDEACSQLESSGSIIGARIAASDDVTETCIKAGPEMTDAIQAFRSAVKGRETP